MRKMRKRIYLLMLFNSLMFLAAYAQSPPSIDENWQLNTTMSDEFNSTSLDNSKWDILYCIAGECYGEGAMHYQHVILDGNYLKLKTDYINYELWAAGIRGDRAEYSYGYFEIRVKLPGYYNNGEPCGKGFFPAFWLAYSEKNNDCWNVLDEIDILEPTGLQYSDARTNVFGWHDELGDCTREKVDTFYHNNLPVLFEGFHKFAVEWLPETIVYYFDDEPIYSSFNDGTVPNHPMQVFIDQQLGGGAWINRNTPLPQYMTVDYFRYYQLKLDCSNDATITSNTQLNDFNFKVKRNITVGNNTSNISLLTGDKVTFRATNTVTLKGTFTVPKGSELHIIPTECY